MQRRPNKRRSAEAEAKAVIVDYVYRWFLHGKGKLFKDDNDPTNKGLREGVQQWCGRLYELNRGETINPEGDPP